MLPTWLRRSARTASSQGNTQPTFENNDNCFRCATNILDNNENLNFSAASIGDL